MVVEQKHAAAYGFIQMHEGLTRKLDLHRCTQMYSLVYTYIEGERERQREIHSYIDTHTDVNTRTHTQIHTYLYNTYINR